MPIDKKSKLPTDRNAALSQGQNPLLKDMFRTNVNYLQARKNADRLQTANFYGGLPSQALTNLKSNPDQFQRFQEFSKRRGAKKRATQSDYMLRYNEEVDKPFNVPLEFSIPDAINRTSVGAPGMLPQTQLPEFGFGSWLKDNGAGLLKGAGSLVSMIPGIGTIAGPILSTAGSVIGKVQGDNAAVDAQQAALDEQAAAQKAEQDVANRNTRRTNIVNDKQVNYGATFETGGQIGQGFMGQPQITDYSNGEKHGESATGGIPVDARGNPATTSRQSAVGLTEKGEVTWNGYVFSDKLKNK